MSPSNKLSCEAMSFSCCLNPHRFFQSEVLRLYFSCSVTLGCTICLAPQCSSWFTHTQVWYCPLHQPLLVLTQSSSCCLAVSPVCPSCPSLLLLLVWMNVSSLTPWLSDFHTVRFSVSSGYFLFLNLLLSFLWLCKEAQCIYLHVHLGWNSH